MSEDSKTKVPEGTSIVLVKNPPNKDGVDTFRKMQKGPDGKFQKQAKPPLPVIDFVRAGRKRLAQIREGTGKTEDLCILEELLDIIHTPVGIDRKTGLPDAKFASAKAKCIEVAFLFYKGKPATAESDLDALKRDGVTLVIIEPPPLDTPTQPAAIEVKKSQPSFADVMSVETNPQN